MHDTHDEFKNSKQRRNVGFVPTIPPRQDQDSFPCRTREGRLSVLLGSGGVLVVLDRPMAAACYGSSRAWARGPCLGARVACVWCVGAPGPCAGGIVVVVWREAPVGRRRRLRRRRLARRSRYLPRLAHLLRYALAWRWCLAVPDRYILPLSPLLDPSRHLRVVSGQVTSLTDYVGSEWGDGPRSLFRRLLRRRPHRAARAQTCACFVLPLLVVPVSNPCAARLRPSDRVPSGRPSCPGFAPGAGGVFGDPVTGPKSCAQ